VLIVLTEVRARDPETAGSVTVDAAPALLDAASARDVWPGPLRL
jgi:hypothetical protein